MNTEKTEFQVLVDGKVQQIMTTLNRDLETFIYVYMKETGADIKTLKLVQRQDREGDNIVIRSYVEPLTDEERTVVTRPVGIY